MSNLIAFIPFIFLFLVFITILLVSVGLTIFFKLNKILFELKMVKDELSYQSDNLIEEAASDEILREEFKVMAQEVSKLEKATQDMVKEKIESMMQEFGIAKKTYDERRWGSLKDALKPQQRQQE